MIAQHLYDLRYIDAVAARDYDTDGNDTLDGRHFYSHSDLFSVQALVTGGGTVVERYEYDPYGKVTVLDARGTFLHRTCPDHRRGLGRPLQRMGGRAPA
jgi:hypothetical protein